MKLLVTLAFLLYVLNIAGQDLQYNFNDCSLSEANGLQPDGISTSVPDCVCGIIENGMYFDGIADYIDFDHQLDSLLEENFTLSFYFRLEDSGTSIDIFSVKSKCLFDSLITLTYQPINNKITFQIGNNIGLLGSFDQALDTTLCWHRFVLTKADLVYTWYLDGIQEDVYVAPSKVAYGKNARVSFGNGPCTTTGSESRFKGWIDEFDIYSRALSSIELTNNDLMPDKVLNRDTTIVQGESIDVLTGPTCAVSWSWSPTAGIDDPSLLDIVVTPDQTTTYILKINNPSECITEDEVTIFVIDEAALDCESLLLPNAFTPNGDQLNDVYGISNLFLVEDIEYFEIYDRWGAKIWESFDKTDSWNGMYGSDPVNPGMYVYKIKYTCKGEEYVKLDNFSVLR